MPPKYLWMSAMSLSALLGTGLAGEVRIERLGEGRFTLLRDGKPFQIRGACGVEQLALLKELGGNSIRTYGVEQLDQEVDGKSLLDRCQELGLTVAAGIWIEHERHDFDYTDEARLRTQREKVRAAVKKHRHHPALLMWSLGNEMEGDSDNPRAPLIWKELNHLAAIVKEEDPDHPVMTVIASSAPAKVKAILEHYPNLDILGVNAYAGASGAGAAVRSAGWNKPFALTEFGAPGHWEVPKTEWDASIEPSGRDKASSYFATHRLLLEEAPTITLGSYAFLWGQKQETTSTWYGMFLKSGEKLPQVDAMCRAWTDQWPTNRCPRIRSVESDLLESVAAPGRLHAVRVTADDPEGDPIEFRWTVTAESTDIRHGGDKETEPPSFPELVVISEPGQAVIRTPGEPGNYRIFITLLDGKGSAATENFCFRVEAP
ncbi:glycoside hydrolase family 2 TIM barrel-domain containing protein [Haloferula sp.]|uniref:glycoside hydrolase family 2 TIM barrel-domain containing protein n=1 Tax=Haloferula sp. TaxID=2497595 RepID=UPI003C757ED9